MSCRFNVEQGIRVYVPIQDERNVELQKRWRRR